MPRHSCIERLEPRCLLTAVVPGFSQTPLVGGLVQPTAMEFAPDGRLFISEKAGTLRVVENGVLLPTPFATLDVDDRGEFGLMGIAFDPDYAANHFVYVYRTVTTPFEHCQVTRLTADPNNPDVMIPGSETSILDLPKLNSVHHSGGAIHFGPDGKLYVAVGENYVPSNAPSLKTPLGKMLRINKDGSIPPDNPFYNQTTGVNRAIWALGLRNPYTFAFQPGTGRMFINDVGDMTWEEVDEGRAGANYGWPATEGATSNPKYQTPFYAYHHGPYDETGGSCIAGGAFYNPPASATDLFPADYIGDYFYADYTGGYIKSIDLSDSTKAGAVTTFATGLAQDVAGSPGPVDLKVGPDGALYALEIGYSRVDRFTFTDSSAPTIATDPQTQLASAGHPVTFTVSASGAQPLSYQWQRNSQDISGATAATYTLAAAQLSDNSAQFRCVVTNSFGSVASNPAILSVTSAQPPVPAITLPTIDTLYRGGDTINFAGTATDPQDGSLPASAFTWTALLHHDQHTHPFMDATSGITSGSMTIPTDGETSSNVYYILKLTVTDSAGLSVTVERDIQPVKANFTVVTNIPSLNLTLDGSPIDSGAVTTGVAGIVRSLGAPQSQAAGSKIYDFIGWSDGGAATHDISTPDVDTTYTANYQERVGAATGPDLTATITSALPALAIGGQAGRFTVRVDNTGADAFSGTLPLRLLLSTDGLLDDNDVEITTIGKKVKVKPGHSASINVKADYPAINDGSYSLLAEVDPDNAVIETNESNNVGVAGPLTVQRPVVDLSGNFPPPIATTVFRGRKSRVVLDVLNSGNVVATGKVTIVLSAATDSAGNGATAIGTITKRLKLNPAAHARLRIKFALPAELLAGTYFFSADIDSTAQISESDETNNVAISDQEFTAA